MERPIFGISRHRMGIDGNGVTTLVAFMGCPLKCRYCLNDQCHAPIYEMMVDLCKRHKDAYTKGIV